MNVRYVLAILLSVQGNTLSLQLKDEKPEIGWDQLLKLKGDGNVLEKLNGLFGGDKLIDYVANNVMNYFGINEFIKDYWSQSASDWLWWVASVVNRPKAVKYRQMGLWSFVKECVLPQGVPVGSNKTWLHHTPVLRCFAPEEGSSVFAIVISLLLESLVGGTDELVVTFWSVPFLFGNAMIFSNLLAIITQIEYSGPSLLTDLLFCDTQGQLRKIARFYERTMVVIRSNSFTAAFLAAPLEFFANLNGPWAIVGGPAMLILYAFGYVLDLFYIGKEVIMFTLKDIATRWIVMSKPLSGHKPSPFVDVSAMWFLTLPWVLFNMVFKVFQPDDYYIDTYHRRFLAFAQYFDHKKEDEFNNYVSRQISETKADDRRKDNGIHDRIVMNRKEMVEKLKYQVGFRFTERLMSWISWFLVFILWIFWGGLIIAYTFISFIYSEFIAVPLWSGCKLVIAEETLFKWLAAFRAFMNKITFGWWMEKRYATKPEVFVSDKEIMSERARIEGLVEKKNMIYKYVLRYLQAAEKLRKTRARKEANWKKVMKSKPTLDTLRIKAELAKIRWDMSYVEFKLEDWQKQFNRVKRLLEMDVDFSSAAKVFKEYMDGEDNQNESSLSVVQSSVKSWKHAQEEATKAEGRLPTRLELELSPELFKDLQIKGPTWVPVHRTDGEENEWVNVSDFTEIFEAPQDMPHWHIHAKGNLVKTLEKEAKRRYSEWRATHAELRNFST